MSKVKQRAAICQEGRKETRNGAHLGGRNVHGGGEGVVGRLRPVDVVVGVHRVLAAQLTACAAVVKGVDECEGKNWRKKARGGRQQCRRKEEERKTAAVARCENNKKGNDSKPVVKAAGARTGQLDGAVGHDLVGVHVRLRAGARLPDAQRKVLVQLALDDLLQKGGKGGGHEGCNTGQERWESRLQCNAGEGGTRTHTHKGV